MTPLDVAQVGPLQMRLLEKPSPVDERFFAPRYYLAVVYDGVPDVTAINYLGHDRAHAERKFVRHVNHAHLTQQRTTADDWAGNA